MALRPDILHTLEAMRDSLHETLREARDMKHVAFEEEVLDGIANIDRTTNNALRQVKKARGLLRNSDMAKKSVG